MLLRWRRTRETTRDLCSRLQSGCRVLVWSWIGIAALMIGVGLGAADARGGEPPELVREALARQLFSIVFVDHRHGWVVGGNGTILSTGDGGETWSRHSVGTDTLVRVNFSDPHHGWVVATAGTLYTTQNGGRSWQKLQAPMASVLGAQLLVGGAGWLVGETVLATQDGGTTWRHQQVPGSPSLSDIACASASMCVAVGKGGIVVTTIDGGSTWVTRPTPLRPWEEVVRGRPVRTDPWDISRVHIGRDGTVWASGGGHNWGFLLRSDDNGQSWTLISDSLDEGPTSLAFLDREHGVVAGSGIKRTRDGGRTWVRETDGLLLQALYFVDEKVGWAAGDYGAVLRTRTGGRSWLLLRTEKKSVRP